MIAQIYPIKRMPRAVNFFDYHIPETMQEVQRGQLVVIPFRQSVVHGIVARVTDKPARGIKLKSILAIDSRISLSDNELYFFESLAFELAQSASSILYSVLPTIPKRLTHSSSTKKQITPAHHFPLTIPESESAEIVRIAKQLTERHCAFAYLMDIKRMAVAIAFYLREKPKQKCVILAPTVVDAERLHAHLHSFSPILFTADESDGDQFTAWTSFRSAETGMIIGTKNVLFATDTKTTTIFLVRSSSAHHGHHEQNPRFDARVIAETYEHVAKTNLFLFDVMPRVEDLYAINDINVIGNTRHEHIRLVDMEQSHRASPVGGFLSFDACDAIHDALEKSSRALCVLNQKSRVDRLRCTTCKSIAACLKCKGPLSVDDLAMRCVRCGHTEARTNQCTRCQTKTLESSTQGNNKMAQILQNEFPDAKFCSIDKEHPIMDTDSQIVLTTSFYLEELFNPFQPQNFGTVVILDADGPLYQSSYRAVEQACYEIERWNAVALGSRASLIIQTHAFSLFHEYLEDPIAFLKNELTLRATYEQPPFRRIAFLQFTESEPRKAELRMTACIKSIRERLKDVRLTKLASNKHHVYTLELRYTNAEKSLLLDLFRAFPDDILIDMQADSR